MSNGINISFNLDLVEEYKVQSDDLSFLFGRGRFEQVRIEAENSWLEGKDADANPYKQGTQKHDIWYSQWLQCNKNC